MTIVQNCRSQENSHTLSGSERPVIMSVACIPVFFTQHYHRGQKEEIYCAIESTRKVLLFRILEHLCEHINYYHTQYYTEDFKSLLSQLFRDRSLITSREGGGGVVLEGGVQF